MSRSWTITKITVCAVLCALAAISTLVLEIPIIPGMPFLKYDPSSALALVAGLLYGPSVALIVGTLPYLLHIATASGIYGVLMSIIASLSYLVPAMLIAYSTKTQQVRSTKHKWLGGIVGIVVTTGCCIAANLIITPIYTGMPVQAVLELIPVALLPFNLAKAIMNTILACLMYEPLNVALKHLDI